jgi:hypothetical protein
MWSPSSARRRHDEHKADRRNYTALKEHSIKGVLLDALVLPGTHCVTIQQLDDASAVLEPALLQRGDRIKVRLLLRSSPAGISVTGRVGGVPNVDSKSDLIPRGIDLPRPARFTVWAVGRFWWMWLAAGLYIAIGFGYGDVSASLVVVLLG